MSPLYLSLVRREGGRRKERGRGTMGGTMGGIRRGRGEGEGEEKGRRVDGRG